MIIKKKVKALLLGALMICNSIIPSFAASGVTNGNISIGGANAKISTITMDVGRTFEIMVANNAIDSHEPGKTMVSKAKEEGDVVAAINGGFFNMSNWAVCNSMIQNGKLISCGGLTHAVGITYEGEVLMDKVTFNGLAAIQQKNGSPFEISSWSINHVSTSKENTVSFLNQYCKSGQKVPKGGKAFVVENGVITNIITDGELKPNASQDILVYNAAALAAAEGWNTVPEIGDSVTMGFVAKPTKPGTEAKWKNAKSVMGGAASLVLNGQDVSHDNNIPASDQQPNAVNQKIFVAKMNNGEIILGTVYSSYAKVAKAMIEQGAADVIAMDGGASSMLYSDGSYLLSAGRQLTMGLAVVDEPNGKAYAANTASAVSNSKNTYEKSSAAEEDKVSATADANSKSGNSVVMGTPTNTESKTMGSVTESAVTATAMASRNSSIMDTPANAEKKEAGIATVKTESKTSSSETSSSVPETKTETVTQTVTTEFPVTTKSSVTTKQPASVTNTVNASANSEESDEIESLLAFTRLAEQNLANQQSGQSKSSVTQSSVPTEASATAPVQYPTSEPQVNKEAQPVNTFVLTETQHTVSTPAPIERKTFGDNENVSRGAFCDNIISAIRSKAGKSVTELAQEKGDQPTSDSDALVKLGIVTSTAENSLISRKEAAVAVYTAHNLLTGGNSSALHNFNDCDGLSDEELFAISYVVSYGMMLGDDNLFDPYVAMTGRDLNSIMRNF